MTGPLDPAEVERVRAARAAGFERQDELIEACRIGDITMDQLSAAGKGIDWPRWSRWTLGLCMPGCAIEHGPDDALEDQVSHEAVVALVPTMQPGRSARVFWGFVDDLAEGTRSRPEVVVDGADDGLSPRGARHLGNALSDAAAAVEQWQAGA
jgi:hypothetical protein